MFDGVVAKVARLFGEYVVLQYATVGGMNIEEVTYLGALSADCFGWNPTDTSQVINPHDSAKITIFAPINTSWDMAVLARLPIVLKFQLVILDGETVTQLT